MQLQNGITAETSPNPSKFYYIITFTGLASSMLSVFYIYIYLKYKNLLQCKVFIHILIAFLFLTFLYFLEGFFYIILNGSAKTQESYSFTLIDDGKVLENWTFSLAYLMKIIWSLIWLYDLSSAYLFHRKGISKKRLRIYLCLSYSIVIVLCVLFNCTNVVGEFGEIGGFANVLNIKYMLYIYHLPDFIYGIEGIIIFGIIYGKKIYQRRKFKQLSLDSFLHTQLGYFLFCQIVFVFIITIPNSHCEIFHIIFSSIGILLGFFVIPNAIILNRRKRFMSFVVEPFIQEVSPDESETIRSSLIRVLLRGIATKRSESKNTHPRGSSSNHPTETTTTREGGNDFFVPLSNSFTKTAAYYDEVLFFSESQNRNEDTLISFLQEEDIQFFNVAPDVFQNLRKKEGFLEEDLKHLFPADQDLQIIYKIPMKLLSSDNKFVLVSIPESCVENIRTFLPAYMGKIKEEGGQFLTPLLGIYAVRSSKKYCFALIRNYTSTIAQPIQSFSLNQTVVGSQYKRDSTSLLEVRHLKNDPPRPIDDFFIYYKKLHLTDYQKKILKNNMKDTIKFLTKQNAFGYNLKIHLIVQSFPFICEEDKIKSVVNCDSVSSYDELSFGSMLNRKESTIQITIGKNDDSSIIELTQMAENENARFYISQKTDYQNILQFSSKEASLISVSPTLITSNPKSATALTKIKEKEEIDEETPKLQNSLLNPEAFKKEEEQDQELEEEEKDLPQVEYVKPSILERSSYSKKRSSKQKKIHFINFPSVQFRLAEEIGNRSFTQEMQENIFRETQTSKYVKNWKSTFKNIFSKKPSDNQNYAVMTTSKPLEESLINNSIIQLVLDFQRKLLYKRTVVIEITDYLPGCHPPVGKNDSKTFGKEIYNEFKKLL